MKTEAKTKLTVTFHFGAAHVDIENPDPSTSVGSLKEIALGELKIQPTPGVEYQVEYHGSTVIDESQSLHALVGEHIPATVVFHLKKILKGG